MSASTPRCTICPFVGPTGSRRPSHSPAAAVHAPPATARAEHLTLRCPSTLSDSTCRVPPAAATTPCTAPSAKVTPRAAAAWRNAAAMPRPSTRAEPGADRTRWTGPSGGKSDPASSGVISVTSPGERRSTRSANGANHPSSCGRRPTERIPQAPYPAPAVSTPSAVRRASNAG